MPKEDTKQTVDTSQESTQQQMNYDAQQQSVQRNYAPVQQLDPNDVRKVPGYLPPRDAAAHVTAFYQRAREMERKRDKSVALPDSAKPLDVTQAQYIPMPDGGLATLVETLFPDDFGNDEAMSNHVFDLLTMNRGALRDDTNHSVGQLVRIK